MLMLAVHREAAGRRHCWFGFSSWTMPATCGCAK
jgi:hypothetical protein